MKLLLLILPIFLTPFLSYADASYTLSQKLGTQAFKNIKKKASFNYSITYLALGLAPRAQQNATYNRFNSGQDYKGDDIDATSSLQIYHAFAFGYQVSKNLKLSYSSTYQDDLHPGIKYNVYNSDGSVWKVNKRKKGISHNNQRINASISNIYNNKYFFLMSNFYYERATTRISQGQDMTYALGIQPTVGIFSNIPGLFHGVKGSIERDYYKRQEFTSSCANSLCTTKYQTLRASITSYLGYNVSDKLHLHSELTFDWDQKGDQVELLKFNRNMDDIIELGPQYSFSKNMSAGARIQKAITSPDAQKSAIILNLKFSL